MLGTGGDGRLGSRALGEDGDPDIAPGAMREGYGTTYHLIALARIHAEVE